MLKTLFVFGTRPEAIKLCPVILHLRSRPSEFSVEVCLTGQHREMTRQVMDVFGVAPEYDLDLMLPGQTLLQSTSRILAGLEAVMGQAQPDIVYVQGDTTSTFCGGLAAFYQKIPVGHLEAGLRTGDLAQPFPEELNRVLTSRLAFLHFAATKKAAGNLCREGVDGRTVFVTGNSGIDAVLIVRNGLQEGRLTGFDGLNLDPARKLILVTAHRRESFGEGFENICRAIGRLADRPDVEVIFPVHPNPNVRGPVTHLLGDHPNITLIDPLGYVPFVDLMRRSYLLLTDSGGVQEEGPSLGKPILVMREKTERPEAIEAGTVKLVGSDEDRIFREATNLLENREAYQAMARVHNPYGDGCTSRRVADLTLSFFGKKSFSRSA